MKVLASDMTKSDLNKWLHLDIAPSIDLSCDLQWYGGKAMNLAKLHDFGFQVPYAFAFDNEELTWISNAHLDFDLERWISAICGGYPVAVRSSAASEDGVSTSFAGQYDTVLNCNNVREVLEALRKVYKSGSSNRVQSYVEAQLSLTERGQDSSLEICAVVQHMVKATVSGVMFTAEPVESDTSQIFIEAVSGLGDKMVSGYASPDSWLFDKYSGNIIESYSMSTPVLERDQLEELFDTGKQIEAEFGCPQDIEWAFDRNKLFILQTRPITTLSKV